MRNINKSMTIAQQLEQKGIEQGIEEGIKQGIEQAKLEIAQLMLKNGLDHKTIIAFTGLTAKQLSQICH